MKKKFMNIIFLGLVLVGLASMSGCANTWEGVGKDIEEMGKDIQKSTD